MTPIACPHCQSQTYYLAEYEGQVVACPHCGGHMLMSLPEVAQTATPAAKTPSVSLSVPSQPRPEPAIPPIKTFQPAASQATSGTSSTLIALIAVIGLSVIGVGAVLVVGAGYLLLRSSAKVEVAETAPQEPAAPTATEVLAQFAPPFEPSGELIASAPPIAAPATNPPLPFANPGTESISPPTESSAASAPITFDFSTVPSAPPNEQRSPTAQPTQPRVVASHPQETVTPVTVRSSVSPAATLKSVVPQAELPTLASTAPELITPHGVTQVESLRLRLVSTAADVAEKAAFFTLRSPGDPLVWDVSYTADLEAEQPQVVPLGSFLVSPENVSFQWREPFSDAELRRQLKNCVLVLEADNTSAHVVLRKSIATDVVKLDVERDKQLQDFQLSDLPAKSRIFAEIRGEGFPVDGSAGAIAKTLSVGPDEEVLIDRLPGAELGLRISTYANGLNLTVAPRFREKGSVIPLSRPKLEATKKAMETAISRTKVELEEESQKIADYQRAIRNLPNVPAGSPAAVARGIQLNKLERDIKRAANRISGLQRQVPAMEARLKAVPEVEKLINQLDGRELSIETYADCGDYRLPLVFTRRGIGSDAQQSQQQDRNAFLRQLALMVAE